MNYYEHHIGDYAEATSHLSFIEDAAYSRLIRKYYATERPLPNDVKAVQRLIGARTKEEREAVELILREFFDLREDGWHNVRCDEELERYWEGAEDRVLKCDNDKERKRRSRERRKLIFAQLRSHGITPSWDTPTSELVANMSRVTGRDKDAQVTPLSQQRSHTGDAPRTAIHSHSPLPISQTPDLIPPTPLSDEASEPIPASETGVEKNGAGPPERKRLNESVERVFEHWCKEHNHPGSKLEAKRSKLIRDALAMGYSEADLCQSISGYKNSPHHMGQNPRNTVYDSIELLLRDAKHIDAGLRFYREPPRTDLSEQTRRIIDQTADWTPPEVRNAAR